MKALQHGLRGRRVHDDKIVLLFWRLVPRSCQKKRGEIGQLCQIALGMLQRLVARLEEIDAIGARRGLASITERYPQPAPKSAALPSKPSSAGGLPAVRSPHRRGHARRDPSASRNGRRPSPTWPRASTPVPTVRGNGEPDDHAVILGHGFRLETHRSSCLRSGRIPSSLAPRPAPDRLSSLAAALRQSDLR